MSNTSAEMQMVYSTATADWATTTTLGLKGDGNNSNEEVMPQISRIGASPLDSVTCYTQDTW